MNQATSLKWWQEAVFYQIYPRSFADGNGDGIGDFKGMIAKLDYLQQLGVDAIWLSPHFPSPYVDCGYDVSDYQDVAPEYGKLDEFKEFLAGLHQRGMKLVLDLVLNHTSDQHPWFIESRSSRDNPKRDWYMWRDGKNGNPPNNWYSSFGGSAWEYDPVTDSYYYHYFFKEQPDLNWHNPQVKEAMFNAARFWLDMGVDGYRLDAVGTMFEDETYPPIAEGFNQEGLYRLSSRIPYPKSNDEVMKYWMTVFSHQNNLPEVHDVMKELRSVIDEYEDRVLIGETDAIAFYGNGDDELHLNFNFPLMRKPQLSAALVRTNQRQRLGELPPKAWPCNTLGNHDTARMYTYFGDGKNNDVMARLHLLMLLTLKGTPFLYNGEEIGMSDLLLDDPKKFRDPLSLLYADLERKVMGSDEKSAVLQGAIKGRDRNRTPMQWTGDANGGFSPPEVVPWLPVNPDFANGVNVSAQTNKSDSMLNYYRELLKFRKLHSALQSGEYEEISTGNVEVFGFRRMNDHDDVIVLLNFTDQTQNVALSQPVGEILFSSLPVKITAIKNGIVLSPYQGVVLYSE